MKVYPIKDTDNQKAMEQLLQRQSPRNHAIWCVGTFTGLRVSDIVSLKVSDVQGTYLSVVEQKTKKRKTVKINAKLKCVLNAYIVAMGLSGNQPLFPSRQNTKISTRQVQRIVKAAAKVLGLDRNINSHSMRKTFAYNLYVITNYNIATVMQALNHSKEAITLKYLGLLEDELDAAIDLL